MLEMSWMIAFVPVFVLPVYEVPGLHLVKRKWNGWRAVEICEKKIIQRHGKISETDVNCSKLQRKRLPRTPNHETAQSRVYNQILRFNLQLILPALLPHEQYCTRKRVSRRLKRPRRRQES